MRLLFITSSLPRGPAEAFVAPEILELRHRGHEVRMVPMRPLGDVFHDDAGPLEEVSVVRPIFDFGIAAGAIGTFARRPLRTLALLWAMLRASRSVRILLKNLAVAPKGLWLAGKLRRWRPDHVHVYWASASATMAMIAAELEGVSWSLTAYRWDIAENNMLRRKAESACFCRVADRAGAAEFAQLAGLGGAGLPAPLVIHSGVRIEAGEQESPVGPPPRPDSTFRILMPALFVEKKGHRYMVEAVALLRSRGMDVHCGLAGDGPLKDEIRDAVIKAGLQDHVRFLGMLSHGVWQDELRSGRWDAIVMPSIETASGEKEGIPVSLVEAMAHGVPVITTDAGGMPELLEGGAGVLVPQRDPGALAAAVESLARDPALRDRYARAGRARVLEGFAVESVAEKLERLFSRCAASPRDSGLASSPRAITRAGERKDPGEQNDAGEPEVASEGEIAGERASLAFGHGAGYQDTGRQETSQETNRQDPERHDESRENPGRQDTSREDTGHQDASRQEPCRQDSSREDPGRQDARSEDTGCQDRTGDSGVSVAIVNYNAGEVLPRCLEALHAQAPDAEIVVVDNASDDGSPEDLERRFPEVRLIRNSRNEGFPAAANQAVEACRGEIVFLLNPDTAVEPGAVSRLIQELNADPAIGVVAPKLIYADGRPQSSAWRAPSTLAILGEYFFLERFLRVWPGYRPRDYEPETLRSTVDVETVSGAAMLFRRRFFLDLGGFDPSLFWIEDVDLCVRVRAAGKRVVYVPDATVVHHSGVSARKNYRVSLSNQIFNKIKYMRKHGSTADRLVVTLISLVHVAAKLLVLVPLSPFRPVWAEKARAYSYTLPRLFSPPDCGGIS